MKVVTVEEIRMLDKIASEKYGVNPVLLMENAGHAVYYVIYKEYGVKDKTFLVFSGGGNNGGDGFVVTRKLYSMGADVIQVILGRREKYRDEARMNLDIIERFPVKKVYREEVIDKLDELLDWADIIIDGIFGTGLSRPVEGIYKDIIEAINKSGKTVVSIDIPSGVNADTGEVMGVAVKADVTITFGLPKIGLFLYPGASYVGKLYVCYISYPVDVYTRDAKIKTELNTPVEIPPRYEDTHKGSYGKALFISGSANYLGAPYFSAMSFLKAGGGLSYLATAKSVAPFIAVKGSEIVFIPLKETETGSIALENLDFLLDFSKKIDFVVIGPGLSLNEETQELVRKFVENVEKPVLIDGDGLTAISKETSILKKRRHPTILTPHPGEMSRLTGLSISDIKKDKINILRKYCKEFNSIIVLKGAHSLIGYPDGRIYINLSGNPGMATAGSGDVLTGTIAALYGLGLSIDDAVRIGVFIHGLAGDLAAQKLGMDGVTAGEILNMLPEAMRYYRENFDRIKETCYNKVFTI